MAFVAGSSPMLWDWPARLYAPEDTATNDDYCVYAKPAQDVVWDYYTHFNPAS